MRTGKLTSSAGYVTFDVDSGSVIECTLDPEDYPEDRRPRVIDVDEWLLQYPGESHLLTEDHDILDFGFWMLDGKYEPPCDAWREECLLRKGDMRCGLENGRRGAP